LIVYDSGADRFGEEFGLCTSPDFAQLELLNCAKSGDYGRQSEPTVPFAQA
jgi:hypothetical protein